MLTWINHAALFIIRVQVVYCSNHQDGGDGIKVSSSYLRIFSSQPQQLVLLKGSVTFIPLAIGPIKGPQSFQLLTSVKLSVCQGPTRRREEETGEIYITRVIHGGLADHSGVTNYLICDKYVCLKYDSVYWCSSQDFSILVTC